MLLFRGMESEVANDEKDRIMRDESRSRGRSI